MPQASETRAAREAEAPDNPTELPRRSWPQTLKRTGKQFSEDKLTTWAAVLFMLLSIALTIMLSRNSGDHSVLSGTPTSQSAPKK